MVLLDLMARLALRHGWQLAVAHFNHRLRGRESDLDEHLVRQEADRRGLACFVERGDVRTLARRTKQSLEMAARELRLRFLVQTARQWGAEKVAMAHHADDQVELFFIRLLRGAGGEGLEGMHWITPVSARWVSDGSETTGVTLIRPLLHQTRAELRAYATERGLAFREDDSNQCTDILRNRIRHDLLPRLERDYQPGLRRTVLRLMDLVGAEAAAVREWAEHWLEEPSAGFSSLPLAVQRAVLRLQLLRLGHEPSFDLVEQLRLLPGRRVSATRGMWYVRGLEGQVKPAQAEERTFRTERITLSLTPKGQASFGGVALRWSIQPCRNFRRPRARAGVEYLDAEVVGPVVCVRYWQPGDRFQPLGFARAAKLQDLFTAAKVSIADRRRRLVAATPAGTIFWVEGLPPGEPFKLTERTRQRLKWQWSRLLECLVAAPLGAC